MMTELETAAPTARKAVRIAFRVDDIIHVFYVDGYHHECHVDVWPNGGKWFKRVDE